MGFPPTGTLRTATQKLAKGTTGYLCPVCQSATAVVDSRQINTGVRRRRECQSCGHRITTYEIELGNHLKAIDDAADILVSAVRALGAERP